MHIRVGLTSLFGQCFGDMDFIIVCITMVHFVERPIVGFGLGLGVALQWGLSDLCMSVSMGP